MLQTLAANYAQKGDSLQNSGWDSFWTPVATLNAILKLSSSPRFSVPSPFEYILTGRSTMIFLGNVTILPR